MAIEQFVNVATSTLQSAITISAATLQPVSVANFSTGPQFRIRVEPAGGSATQYELMLVTNVAAGVFTVTRGIEGTGQQAWPLGSQVSQVITAGALATAFARADTATTWATTQTFAGDVYFKSGHPSFDVRGFGAVGDGVTNDRVAIQQAMDAASNAGGGIVVFPAGTYMVDLAVHPENASYYQGFYMQGGTTIQGAGRGSTVVKLLPNLTRGNDLANNNSMCLNRQLGGGSENITISDITFDGNGVNQTHTQGGVSFIRTRGVRLNRVRCINFRGTASSGPNETFFFETQLGTDTSYTDCEAVGNAGSTASGFSTDGANNVKYSGCVAYGMTVTHGFTHNSCRNVQYVNCHSYLNGSYGFNSEVSFDVLYSNCIAGGYATGGGPGWPFANSAALGNTSAGFTINGSGNVNLLGCFSRGNGSHGLWIAGGCARVAVTSGRYTDNTGSGISIDSASLSNGVAISGPNLFGSINSANTAGNINSNGNVQNQWPGQVVGQPAVPASGVTTQNTFPFPVMVYVAGGTVGAVQQRGSNTGLGTNMVYRLEPLGDIEVLYTAAPSWFWTTVTQ